MRTNAHFHYITLLVASGIPGCAAQIDHASKIASLIDPAKLATLAKRRANPRIQKSVYWLVMARKEGQKPDQVLDRAVASQVTKRRHHAHQRSAASEPRHRGETGCLNEPGLAEMRRGNAATVMRGPYKGDQLSVDHIIPRVVVPELYNVDRQSGI